MITEDEILQKVKASLERKGVAMDCMDISIMDGILTLRPKDAYNCLCGYNSGFMDVSIDNCSIDDLVYKLKDIFEAWRTIITTADRVYLGE
jgi:hypothetical protein